MNTKDIAIINFADLHICPELATEQYEHFVPLINDIIECKKSYKYVMVVNLGDFLNERVGMHTKAGTVAHRIVYEIKQTGAMFLNIHGTLSHDYNQLDTFQHFCDDNFRIYKSVTVVNIWGMRILIIPEEYEDMSYYDEYIKNVKEPYDFVFGHCTFTHASFYQKTLSRFKQTTAPTFSVDQFKDIVHGHVMCGHIHTRSMVKNMIYCG